MKIIEKQARPAQKHLVQTNQEQNSLDTQKGLTQVEGILTSPIKTKKDHYFAFFQLEGIDQDIPVIFRVEKPCPYCPPSGVATKCKWSGCGYLKPSQPNIPLRAKILLKGNWSESLTSPRPSFTCLEYQILVLPPQPTIKGLKEQISSLLITSLEKQSE